MMSPCAGAADAETSGTWRHAELEGDDVGVTEHLCVPAASVAFGTAIGPRPVACHAGLAQRVEAPPPPPPGCAGSALFHTVSAGDVAAADVRSVPPTPVT